jgi:hypothetical protein
MLLKIRLYLVKRYLEKKINVLLFMISNFIFEIYNSNINSTVRQQTKDLKTIPIIIINFNQLENLKKLIDFLQENEFKNIIIIDNKSTYLPLLEFYKNMKPNIKLHVLTENYGHRVFWKQEQLRKLYGKGFYVITDADVVPKNDCPQDFMVHFKNILDNNKQLSKVGFSLDLDSIPSENLNKDKIIKWESKFWQDSSIPGCFDSPIDTTFALYRPVNQYNSNFFYNSVRTKPPYSAIHFGWIIDSKKPSSEQIYYNQTANSSFSWKTDEKGQVIQKDY